MGRNKIKSWVSWPKGTTRAVDNFKRVTSLCNRRLTASNITVRLKQCREKNVSTFTVGRIPCEACLYDRIAVKKPLFRKNNVKRLRWAKARKHRTTEQWNRVILTDESKFEIFDSNRRVYVRRRVGERAAPPRITPSVKHGGGSVMVCVCVWVGFCQLQSRGFAPGEGKIESDWLSQNTAKNCTHAR